MAAKLKDVALRAGVAISTVNDVLSGRSERYATATCAKIRAAAQALNYRSDIAARGMREGKTYLLGVLFSGVNFLHMTDFLAGLQRVMVQQSYTPILLSHIDLAMEKVNAEVLLNRRVDGLIVTPWIDDNGKFNRDLYDQLRERKIPMVEVFSRLLDGIPKVNFDNAAAARLAVRHLVSRGHKRIAQVVHSNYATAERIPGLYWSVQEFTKGYETEIRACQLAPITVTRKMEEDLLHAGHIYGQAFEMAPRLLQHPSHPSAAICFSDEEAEGLIHYATRNRELVPPGFEVVSMSTSQRKIQTSIPMHYVRWTSEEVGTAAANSLLAVLNKEPVHDVLILPQWLPPSSIPVSSAFSTS